MLYILYVKLFNFNITQEQRTKYLNDIQTSEASDLATCFREIETNLTKLNVDNIF